MLQQDRALEIFAAMQAGAQNEMAIEQRAGFAEKREQIFAHFVVGRFFIRPFELASGTDALQFFVSQ
jgi:hypothetical protein